jgi:hypothetical protein
MDQLRRELAADVKRVGEAVQTGSGSVLALGASATTVASTWMLPCLNSNNGMLVCHQGVGQG